MTERCEKNYEQWNKLKKKLNKITKYPTIKEGDIWWCAVGANIGIEIDGKSERFSRPVLIYKKLSREGFMAIPLTSKNKAGSWYVNFVFLDKTQTAALCQASVMSASRLYTKIGQIPKSDFDKVKEGFRRLYL